jgi:hypothetical protein
MANTYNWVVSNLHAKIENDGMQNVIETIHWRLQATDENENVVDVYGSCGLEAPEADSFISFDSLTQSDIEGWLELKLDVDSLKANLDAKIESIVSPTHVDLQLAEQTETETETESVEE